MFIISLIRLIGKFVDTLTRGGSYVANLATIIGNDALNIATASGLPHIFSVFYSLQSD